MSDIVRVLVTGQLQPLFIALVVLIAASYLISVIWVAVDARKRGMMWPAWALFALIPFVGFIVYCLARPTLYADEQEEQDLEIALARRQLAQYGECPHCGYPTEAEFVMCPNCHQRLKNLCNTCRHALDPKWTVCPYCTTPVGTVRPSHQRMD